MARKGRVLVAAGALIALVLVIAASIYVTHGSSSCHRCLARRHWSVVKVMGLTFQDQYEIQQQGPAVLQKVQTICPHDWDGRPPAHNYLYYRFWRATDSSPGRPPRSIRIIQAMEPTGDIKEGLREFVWMAEEARDNSWNEWQVQDLESAAWFIQLLSGRDFGISYDMEERRPVTRSDSIGRILDWAVEEKVLEPGERDRLRVVQSRPSGT